MDIKVSALISGLVYFMRLDLLNWNESDFMSKSHVAVGSLMVPFAFTSQMAGLSCSALLDALFIQQRLALFTRTQTEIRAIRKGPEECLQFLDVIAVPCGGSIMSHKMGPQCRNSAG